MKIGEASAGNSEIQKQIIIGERITFNVVKVLLLADW